MQKTERVPRLLRPPTFRGEVAEPGALHSYVLLCVAFCVQGVCDGIMNGPLVALMDDSCPAGRRCAEAPWSGVGYSS